MNDEQLDAVESKAKAATPGPWVNDALFVYGRTIRVPSTKMDGFS